MQRHLRFDAVALLLYGRGFFGIIRQEKRTVIFKAIKPALKNGRKERRERCELKEIGDKQEKEC